MKKHMGIILSIFLCSVVSFAQYEPEAAANANSSPTAAAPTGNTRQFAYSLKLESRSLEALKHLPVQDGGRLKPYDTFAREALQLVYGRQTYQGRPAVAIVTTWLLAPQLWDGHKFVQIQHSGLKTSLDLPTTQKYFTPNELVTNGRLGLVFQELAARRENKEKLNPYYQAVQRLENQLATYQLIRGGLAPHVVPPKEGDKWLAVGELQGSARDQFMLVTRAFISALPGASAILEQKKAEGEEAADIASVQLSQAVDDFIRLARAENPELYPKALPIQIEVHLNSFHPFMWSWILYLLAACALGFAWGSSRPAWFRWGWALTWLAFILHTYGFGLRVYLTGRPPVSNMYETVIWVAWGSILFAMMFEYFNRRIYVLLSGAVVAVLCLVTADLAPVVLDRSIQPLEPVLRSTLWLTVHVLTITISYANFFLAWALGMLGLFFILKGESVNSERIRGMTHTAYRSIQVGVVLLAAGIILGGVWADYSWGRFWGWDPKETWALIALLGYLAMLHGRLIGLIQNFGFLVCSIVTMSLVIMAWYGVNFVLGAGLHSYGFGAGGVEYVSGFVLLQLIYVGYVAYVRSRLKTQQSSGESAA